MFEPVRIGFVLAGVLLLIGAMFYAVATMTVPGGFADLAASFVYLYWFAVIIFVIAIFLRSLQLIVEAIKRKKKNAPDAAAPTLRR